MDKMCILSSDKVCLLLMKENVGCVFILLFILRSLQIDEREADHAVEEPDRFESEDHADPAMLVHYDESWTIL